MTESAAANLCDRLLDWGVDTIYGFPGRHQRDPGRAARASGSSSLHPGAPRGDGRVHGLRPRQVHGQGRRLHGDLRPGRDPPAQRALRRQARPPARGGDRRADLRQALGGTSSRRSTSPASSRTSPRLRAAGQRPRDDSALHRPGDPHRAGRAHGHLRDRPRRRPGHGRGPEQPRATQGDPLRGRLSPAGLVPDEADCSGGATSSTPARGWRCWSARARWTPPRRCWRSPTLLGAGIAKALLGKAAVPDDVPSCTGSIGLLGTKPSWEMMQGCDTLLMVGSASPTASSSRRGQARGVQIDIVRAHGQHALSDGARARR